MGRQRTMAGWFSGLALISASVGEGVGVRLAPAFGSGTRPAGVEVMKPVRATLPTRMTEVKASKSPPWPKLKVVVGAPVGTKKSVNESSIAAASSSVMVRCWP